ncbi:DUF1697 domain-containing protein [Plebeiibacterium sediminum]|uniref:DUF1697 domain-containing protein n=1 Tax=Plebeiibacterium sediminum TaxID=2992112 RepID=A0AAE3M519_9BACT|nr:DUF1697 domain-containing protein [Plebeiobacterium sediminum]MCW3787274.1 DUF1697 domain-containing protein [Plebeiobacterium sediminum]
MIKYISILRGINVGGKKVIKMDALRKMYENLGFQNVTTYIQSGNVIFKGDDTEITQITEKISLQIEKDFGFGVPVIVFTIEDLKEMINQNPFVNDSNKDISHLHVTFLSSEINSANKNGIKGKKQDGEEVCISEKAIYLYCPKGYSKTKLTNTFIENTLGVTATTRNWKTTTKLLQIADQIE